MASPKSPTSGCAFRVTLLCTALLAVSSPARAQEEPSPAPTESLPPTPAVPRDEAQPPESAAGSDPCLADPQCDELYEQARTAFKEARYEDAYNGYQHAYKRRQVPWLLLNSGRALQRLGRLDEALGFYDRYKRSDVKPTPERLAKANQYIGEVKAALEEAAQRKPVVAAAPPPPPAPPPESRPVYKKWWFWTILGGVVVVGAVATGLAVALPRSSTPMTAMQPAIPAGVSVYQPMF